MNSKNSATSVVWIYAYIFLLVTLDPWCQISLGDVQSNYLLTTAENELGVVVAHSEAGNSFSSYLKRQNTGGFQHNAAQINAFPVWTQGGARVTAQITGEKKSVHL